VRFPTLAQSLPYYLEEACLQAAYSRVLWKAHNTQIDAEQSYLSFVQSRRRNEMKCERCESDKEAEFRVISDVLDIKVCADCAGEARRLGTSLKVVEIDKAKNERAASNAEARGYRVLVSDCAH